MNRKKKSLPSQSLKTFYLYTIVVFAVIALSLFVKLVMVIQQSKFDGQHHFTIAITNANSVNQIVSFSPDVPSMSILTVKDKNIAYTTLAKNYGIATDAQLELKNATSSQDEVATTLRYGVTRYPTIRTDATFFDLVRLMLLSQNITSNNTVIREITLKEKNPENNTIIARALNDPALSAENVSIQIINASDISGLGQRLGRILTNMGANVVDVSTSNTSQATSKIQFYSDKTYTLDTVVDFLGYPVTQLSRQPIANIVIILGEDSRETNTF